MHRPWHDRATTRGSLPTRSSGSSSTRPSTSRASLTRARRTRASAPPRRPAIAYALAPLLRREKARLQPSLGVLLAIVGAAWIALVRKATPSHEVTFLGDSLLPTSVCYALNAWALGRAPSTLAAVYTTCQPIIATIAAALVLAERPPVIDRIAATALILLGVTLVALRRVGSP